LGRGKGVRATSAKSIGITFQYRGARCREKLRLAPSPANLKYAERLKATIDHEIATGTFDYAKHFPDSPRARTLSRTPGAAITVAEQLRAWHDSMQGEIERETWDEYGKDISKVLIPRFGELRLAELARVEVKAWASGSELSRKRLNNILIPLRSMLRAALDDGLIQRNPLLDFEVRKPRAIQQEQIDPFTLDEIRSIAAHCPVEFANMVRFWAWSGLRTGEMIALDWGDVDWRRGTLRVSRAVREGRTKATKTEAGTRDIKLLAPALEALQAQKHITFLAGREIWTNPRTQERWTGDGAIRKTAWTYALRKAGVRYRYPYQLRHTFASWMLSAGENPLWVAKQMGHRDWSMIVRTYGRWIPEVDPLAGDRAVRLIYGPTAARSEPDASQNK
jgi:integrase